MDERVARLVALVLAALLPLAACGDDDDTVGADDGTPSAEDVADDVLDDLGDDRDDDGSDDDGSDDDGSDDGAGMGDGCELLTEEDAEALLGEQVEPAPREDDLGVEVLDAYCAWKAETESSFKLVQLNVFDGPQFFSPEVYADSDGFEELDGIGDDAFAYDAGLGYQIQVLDGDETLALDFSGFNVDADKAQVREGLIDLARRVVERN